MWLCASSLPRKLESNEGKIAGLAEEDYLAEAERMQQAVDEMNEAVKQHGWDGEWFLRAYDFFGNKIGSDENEEGKIFIESQGWCTMAGIGLEEDSATRHWIAPRSAWNASTEWC